jgi:hypothetical protein
MMVVFLSQKIIYFIYFFSHCSIDINMSQLCHLLVVLCFPYKVGSTLFSLFASSIKGSYERYMQVHY